MQAEVRLQPKGRSNAPDEGSGSRGVEDVITRIPGHGGVVPRLGVLRDVEIPHRQSADLKPGEVPCSRDGLVRPYSGED